jgi:hypothetical protein
LNSNNDRFSWAAAFFGDYPLDYLPFLSGYQLFRLYSSRLTTISLGLPAFSALFLSIIYHFPLHHAFLGVIPPDYLPFPSAPRLFGRYSARLSTISLCTTLFWALFRPIIYHFPLHHAFLGVIPPD